MNLKPRKHLIQSMRRANTSITDLLYELLDNAFDAGATDVSVYFGPDELSIVDNGCGCPDLRTMLTFGAHEAHVSTESGTNGVGFKDASAGFGDEVTIESTVMEDGIYSTSTITMNWLTFEQQTRTWNWKDPKVTTSKSGTTGTRITINNLRQVRQQTFKNTKIVDLGRRIGWQYRAGLVDGRIIKLYQIPKGQARVKASLIVQVEATPLPDSGWNKVDLEIKGKKAHVQWRKSDPEVAKQAGFWFSKGFRFAENTMDPARNFNGSTILCLIKLDRNWILSTHKNALVDDDREILMDNIAELVEGDLQQWSTESRTMKFRTFFKDVANILEEVISGRGKDPMDEDPTKETGKRVTDEDPTPPRPNPPNPKVDPKDINPRPGAKGLKTSGRSRKTPHGKIDIIPAENQEEIYRVHHTKDGISLYLSTLFEPVRTAVEGNHPEELLLHVAYSLGLHLQSTDDKKLQRVFENVISNESPRDWGHTVARHLMQSYSSN